MATPPRPPRKAGNPPESEWRSTPVAKRKRKPMSVNLSDAARAEVKSQAVEQHDGNKSQAVEAAIWLAAPPERRPREANAPDQASPSGSSIIRTSSPSKK